MFSIDYTRDFSGVLEKSELNKLFINTHRFNHGSAETNKWDSFETPTIINTDVTCGRNTFKYVKKIANIHCIVKYYNKIVSNFETEDVQKKKKKKKQAVI